MRDEAGHLTQEGLAQLVRGELPPAALRQLLQHLMGGCETCPARLASLASVAKVPGTEGAPGAPPVDRYELPFARVLAAKREQAAELSSSRIAAVLDLVRILAEGDGEAGGEDAPPQGERTTSARALWVWCELLIEEAWERRSQDLRGAVELAEVAAGLADELPERAFPSDVLADLQGRAWMELGNLRRVDDDLDGAEWAFHCALRRLTAGTGSPLLVARQLDLTSSLLRARRRFREAFEAIEAARRIYMACGELHLAGRILIKAATAHARAGEPERAKGAMGEALMLLEPKREPTLLVATLHNLLFAWVDAGQSERAARVLWQARPLYEEVGSKQDRLRLLWLEARIAQEFGHFRRAESLLHKAKTGLRAADQSYAAAMAALDLAGVLLEVNRPAEVLGLVDEMLKTFWALRIPREAVAAVVLLREAVLQGTATADLVREIANRLRDLLGT